MRLFQRLNLSPGYISSSKLLIHAFPDSLKKETRQLIQFKGLKVWSEPIKVAVKSEELGIPYRVLAQPFDVSTLPATRRAIYHCLYSRSTDGHVREASVRALLNLPITDWTVPYLFLALSDYVIQVANAVANEPSLGDQLAEFVHKNPELYKLALARTLSYWDLNRHEGIAYADYRDFPPFKVLSSLNKK